MPTQKTRVLTSQQVDLKIQRIAWEIYEKHVAEKELVFVGISKSGFWLAKRIMNVLQDISELNIRLLEMEIYKKKPLTKSIKIHPKPLDLTDQNVVLIDDVLNSGRVLIHGVGHILQADVKHLTTAVLVDRNHKRYPIKADVKGLSLSTSLQEHVQVEIKKSGAEVYLR